MPFVIPQKSGKSPPPHLAQPPPEKAEKLRSPTGYAPLLPPAWGRGVKHFRKVFAGGGALGIFILVEGGGGGGGGTGNFYFGGGGGGGHIILKQKLKLIKSKIKSIFGITNLMYFKDTWKIHLLSSEKISFSMAICPKCLEHLFFQ